jgi:hypothetical protein
VKNRSTHEDQAPRRNSSPFCSLTHSGGADGILPPLYVVLVGIFRVTLDSSGTYSTAVVTARWKLA